MKRLKNYLFGFMLVTSGLLILGSGGAAGLNECIICNGTGESDCIYCVNGDSDGSACTFCNGEGAETCTFCNGTGE